MSKLTKILEEYKKLGISEQIDHDKFYLYSIITHSTAVEGSTVTEIENRLLFDEGISPQRPIIDQLMNLDLKKAYEEAKTKREKYKKIGPIFVAASGVAFLTLIFTLENKITFLILWVITILYTVALMIRAEYKYHQFQYYLGLNEEESDSDDDTEKDDGEEDKPQSVEPEKDESPNTEQEEQA